VADVGGQFITFPLAQSRGFLRQEGSDAEIVLIRGNAALAALTGGDIDYTVGIPQGGRGAGARAADETGTRGCRDGAAAFRL